MNTIIAYQFNSFPNLFTEDDGDIFWLDGCLLKLFTTGTPESSTKIVAKWIIKLK